MNAHVIARRRLAARKLTKIERPEDAALRSLLTQLATEIERHANSLAQTDAQRN